MLQHLSDIARSKRINDGNTKKMHWKDFYLQIVVNPRSALCRIIAKTKLPVGEGFHIVERVDGWRYFWDYLLHSSVFC